MGVKSLDFFRKLNTDSETSSAIGGILTFLAFVVFMPCYSDHISAGLQRNQIVPKD